jgi:hypothetical protein
MQKTQLDVRPETREKPPPHTCKRWPALWAKLPNRYALALCRLDLSGLELRVMFYVISVTWGDYDGKHKRNGKRFARVSTRQLAEALGADHRRTAHAVKSLVDQSVLVRKQKAAGRRPALLGPNPLIVVRPEEVAEAAADTLDLEKLYAKLSPELARKARAAARRSVSDSATQQAPDAGAPVEYH